MHWGTPEDGTRVVGRGYCLTTFTLFDIAKVKEQLQEILKRKVDVVMLNGLKSGIKGRVKNEMQLIYEA